MATVNFFGDDVKVPAFKKLALKRFIKSIFETEGKNLHSLNYIFCSDDKLLEINKSFLNHDYYTDVITFDLSETAENINAEIYISLDRINEHKKKYNSNDELFRVMFHGALHLCGFKDKKKSEITLMRKKEAEYLQLFHSQ